MGRLFWEFFFAILLARCLATVGIGATFWLWGHALDLLCRVIDNMVRNAIKHSPADGTVEIDVRA